MRRNFKVMMMVVITLCMALVFINNTKAATKEEMVKYFSEDFVNSLTEEQYQKFSTLDFSRAKREEKTYQDNYLPETAAPQGSSWNTNYKTLAVSVIPYSGSTKDYAIYLDLTWKYIPAVRSYDVMAMRLSGMVINGKSIVGRQSYVKSNGSSDAVNYSYLGTNMVFKGEDEGFGISMNIVNDSLNSLHCYIEVDGILASSSGTVYGAYEHAVDEVTLAQSKSYGISSVGQGKVINFIDSVWNHYDDMQGVSMTATK